MRYSIEEIRSFRDRYKDPIYPGFSLEDVFERHKANTLALRRSENAYTIKKPSNVREEYGRRVRREMNKLTDSNFEIVLDALKSRPLLLEEDYRHDMVNIIHQKALLEPECSRNYAAACRDLADFETQLTTKGNEKPRSLFRSDLITMLQKEFMSTLEETVKDDASIGVRDTNTPEENEMLREEARTSAMRRKLANIRFIGQLYLHDVFSPATMVQIIKSIMSDKKNENFPSSDNIEGIVELLTTIGKRLSFDDGSVLHRALDQLDKIKGHYPLRIRFMIMDLLDLQKNDWRPKYETQSQPTGSPTDKSQRSAGVSSASPTSSKGGRFASVVPSTTTTWRDVAKKNEGRGGHHGEASSPKAAGKAGAAGKPSASSAPVATVVAGTTVTTPGGKRSVPVSPQASTVQPFQSLVRSTLSEWVEQCDNDFIINWVEPFNHCDRTFESIAELGEAVATEVIMHACMTTHPTAQEEAASFCSVGLDLSDNEILGGFATSLATAINDSIVEDCPKFPERWIRLLRYTSDSLTDLFFDLGSICRDAYNHKMCVSPPSNEPVAENVDEEDDFVDDEFGNMLETLRLFWRQTDAPTAEDCIVTTVVIALIENVAGPPKEGLGKVLAAYLYYLHTINVLEENCLAALQQHQSEVQPELFQDVVRELTRAMYPQEA